MEKQVNVHLRERTKDFALSQTSEIRGRRSKIRLLLLVFGDDAAAAMRTLPVALLEVSARVSDLFTTVLARHRDMLIFRHVARITETCLECILGSAEGEKQCARAVIGYPVIGKNVGQARLPSRSLGEDWSPADPSNGKRASGS